MTVRTTVSPLSVLLVGGLGAALSTAFLMVESPRRAEEHDLGPVHPNATTFSVSVRPADAPPGPADAPPGPPDALIYTSFKTDEALRAWHSESGESVSWKAAKTEHRWGAYSMGLICQSVDETPPRNYVENGSFEDSRPDGAPAIWVAARNISSFTSEAHSGSRAAELEAGEKLWCNVRAEDLRGRPIRVSAMVNGGHNARGVPLAMFLRFSVDGKRTFFKKLYSGQGEWKALILDRFIPPNIDAGSLKLQFVGKPESTSASLVDDVSITIRERITIEPDSDSLVRLYSRPFPVNAGQGLDFQIWAHSTGDPNGSLLAWVEARVANQWIKTKPTGLLGSTHGKPRWMYGHSALIPQGAPEARLVIAAPKSTASEGAWFVHGVRCYLTSSLPAYVEAQNGRERLPDVALVGVDTLSQRVLGCYGNNRAHTPNIDRMAAEGSRFVQVTTAAPWTKPSFASIHTSLYPSQHRVEKPTAGLAAEMTTLAEILKERGYFTAGFAYTRPDGYLGQLSGMAQGFDYYFEATDESEVVEGLDRFLATNRNHLKNLTGGGIFIFLHIMEPHAPYVNRAPESLKNDGLFGTTDILSRDHLGLFRHQYPGEQYLEADVRYTRALYQSEASYTDGLVGNFFRQMDACGLYDDLNVIFCSDHGEALGEIPGQWEHGLGWETIVRTPLILRFPGRIEPGFVDKSYLSINLDILPTVLDLNRTPIPSNVEGYSLLSPPEQRIRNYAFSENKYHGWLTVRDARHKLVVKNASAVDSGNPSGLVWKEVGQNSESMLYDIREDFFEKTDISAEQPEIKDRLLAELKNFLKRIASGAGEASSDAEVELSEETREQLKALGYLE